MYSLSSEINMQDIRLRNAESMLCFSLLEFTPYAVFEWLGLLRAPFGESAELIDVAFATGSLE